MLNTPLIALFFLLGSVVVSGLNAAAERISRTQTTSFKQSRRYLSLFLIGKKGIDPLRHSTLLCKQILLVCYAVTAYDYTIHSLVSQLTWESFILCVLVILSIAIIIEALARIIASVRPHLFFKLLSPPSSFFLLIAWPLSFVITHFLWWITPKEDSFSAYEIKDKILEILNDPRLATKLEPNDRELILSLATFKERIAREIMVPRVDMFTLNADTPIQEAAQSFVEKGYSRIPVWKESVDNIIGTLYYKDILKLYSSTEAPNQQIDGTIEVLIKPIVYTPETKRISKLLQEFKNKHIHLSIVVDEYGGTEGIVTIEDILEELVGEIADEYDYDEEALFFALPSGGWIVDAKMAINDIEDELGIPIPQSPEYDSLGGYIFHKAGTIPQKGWRLHQDEFELEVLSSSVRFVEKVRIRPT